MPETVTAYEFERGKPPPDFAHSATEVCLFGALAKAAGTQFTLLSELTLAMPDGGDLTPDICVYPPMEMDWLRDVERMSAMPRLVIEITTAEHGVSKLWRRIERLLTPEWRAPGWLSRSSARLPFTGPVHRVRWCSREERSLIPLLA